MKKKVSIATWMMIVFAAIGLQAPAMDHEKSDPVVKQLRRHIKFPTAWNENVNEAVVYASFTVSEDGKISVTEVNGTNEDMKMHVVHELEGMKMDVSHAEAGKMYSVKFNFKLIN